MSYTAIKLAREMIPSREIKRHSADEFLEGRGECEKKIYPTAKQLEAAIAFLGRFEECQTSSLDNDGEKI